MDGRRLDLDAPLLSFRRIAVREAGEDGAAPPLTRGKPLPFYNSDLMFGQVLGAVPFVWEKTPGRPKDGSPAKTTFELNPAVPKLPPGRRLKERGTEWLKVASLPPESETVVGRKKAVAEDEEESYSTVCDDEDDAFSDARVAFSCAESFSMKCSTSAGAGTKDSLRSIKNDPQVKDYMMGRFLPAAQAMAEDSPQRTWRKPPRVEEDEVENVGSETIRRRRLPLDYQYRLSGAQLHSTEQEEEEEFDDGYGSYVGSSLFSSRACGLIQRFGIKSSIGPVNSVLGLKSQGRPKPRTHSRTSQIKVLLDSSLVQAEDEDSWEAVYRYKLNRGNYPHRDGSKLMTESIQLTSWSDSQMLDGSSFFNSTGGAPSPDKHEDSKRESRSWRTGSSELCENVYRSYWETSYCHGRRHGSGSTTPATERPHNRVSSSLTEAPEGELVSANIPSDTKTMTEFTWNSSAIEDVLEQTEESGVTKTSEGCPLQSRSSNIVDTGFSSYCGRLNGVDICDNEFDNDAKNDDGLALKVDLMEKNDNSPAFFLLPPPLPTSPSESWLQRALPSVSSKGSHQQSFLGIQFHPKRRVSPASTGGHKSVTHEKPSSLRSHQTRFVEVAKGT